MRGSTARNRDKGTREAKEGEERLHRMQQSSVIIITGIIIVISISITVTGGDGCSTSLLLSTLLFSLCTITCTVCLSRPPLSSFSFSILSRSPLVLLRNLLPDCSSLLLSHTQRSVVAIQQQESWLRVTEGNPFPPPSIPLLQPAAEMPPPASLLLCCRSLCLLCFHLSIASPPDEAGRGRKRGRETGTDADGDGLGRMDRRLVHVPDGRQRETPCQSFLLPIIQAIACRANRSMGCG